MHGCSSLGNRPRKVYLLLLAGSFRFAPSPKSWCTDRCRAAIGVNAVWLNDDQNIKVKMRVWIQPDERMYSSISPSEDITSGREYATRCDVCGTLVFEHVEFENITLSQCVMFLVYMSPQITRTSLEFYHSKINTRVQTLRL